MKTRALAELISLCVRQQIGVGTTGYISLNPTQYFTQEAQMPSLIQNLRPNWSKNSELLGLWEEAQHMAVDPGPRHSLLKPTLSGRGPHTASWQCSAKQVDHRPIKKTFNYGAL